MVKAKRQNIRLAEQTASIIIKLEMSVILKFLHKGNGKRLDVLNKF
jgi:hypothetical protein